MYLKCILENNEIVYKDFTDDELLLIIDDYVLYDELSRLIEDDVDDWNFTNYPTSYSNIFEINLRDFIRTTKPHFSINKILVEKIEFIEQDSYEHTIASFALNNPQPWNYIRKVEVFPKDRSYDEYETEYYAEDPYCDEGPGGY